MRVFVAISKVDRVDGSTPASERGRSSHGFEGFFLVRHGDVDASVAAFLEALQGDRDFTHGNPECDVSERKAERLECRFELGRS